jgi:type II secretory pathway component PulC
LRDNRLAACALVVLGMVWPRAAFLGADAPMGTAAQARAGGQARASLPRTALPMALVGVMVDSTESSGSACLIRCAYPKARTGASFLEAGEIACDLAEVREIRLDAVVVRNQLTGQVELLPLQSGTSEDETRSRDAAPAPEPAVVRTSPGIVSVDVAKASVDHYLLNLTDLLSSAQATPRFKDVAGGQGAIEGFELRQIRAGSVVEKVGLRNGDVIVEVNGETLDGLPTVMRLFGQAQTMGQATVTVLRGGQRMTFVFTTK